MSVSIGLSIGKQAVAGVVYDPNRDELFSAYKGGGAFCNGRRLAVDPATTLEEAIVSTNMGYMRDTDTIQHGTIFHYSSPSTYRSFILTHSRIFDATPAPGPPSRSSHLILPWHPSINTATVHLNACSGAHVDTHTYKHPML